MGRNWKLSYDSDTDILWIHRPGEVADGEELYDDVFAEYDEEKNLIGLEIHIASKTLHEVRGKIEKLIPDLTGKLPDLKTAQSQKKASG